jgi:6-pyruvoyltetrahydropterin/6-carboxytetrahydropterin synthase|tara:strand:- start:454 stop:864 length:411 start_codon:yes stop_codon:yes gene_type:complete
MKVTVSRKAHFNAAHRLFVKSWSDERNSKVFGKCSNPNFHGHNYEIIVNVKGSVDPVTGMVIDLKDLKKIIKEDVEDLLDHKNLNIEIKYFNEVVPTAENICIFIWNILRNKIDIDKEISVTLYETPRNYVKYSGN